MATLPDEVRERVRSYIEHQAAKEPAAIKDIVQQGHDQLLGRIDGVSEEQARFKPGPDDWSVMEVLNHVVTAKRGVARLCATLARGETPGGIGQEGEERPRQDGITLTEFSSLAEARSGAQAAHEELLAFVTGLSPETNPDTRYHHFLFGPLNCREWAAFQRVHDGDHAGQVEQIKAAPGFPRA